jgi:hypothetical protein
MIFIVSTVNLQPDTDGFEDEYEPDMEFPSFDDAVAWVNTTYPDHSSFIVTVLRS